MTKCIPQRQLKSRHNYCLGSQLTLNVVCGEDNAYIIKLKRRGLTQRGRNTDRKKPHNIQKQVRQVCAEHMSHLLEGSLQNKYPKPFWRYIKSRTVLFRSRFGPHGHLGTNIQIQSTGIATIKRRALLVSDLSPSGRYPERTVLVSVFARKHHCTT